MFEDSLAGDSTSSQFLLRRTSWEGHQTIAAHDEDAGQPQLYPPTYPACQYQEQRLVPSKGSMGLVGSDYYPSPNPTSYSPSPHAPSEEVQPVSQPVHVVAPTPVNLIIQTRFTRVEHNFHYASQESDTSSGYGPTPPPTTASSTRSSFSFSSADSPTGPFCQTQEYPGNYNPQGHHAAPNVYLPHPFRHQYDMVDNDCYRPSPLPDHGTSPYHGYPDGGLHPHAAYYPPTGDYGSPDHNYEYESESESDRGWNTCQAPSHELYATQYQAAETWRYPPWSHPASTNSDRGRSDGGHDNKTNFLGSVEHPTSYNAQRR